MANFDSGIKGYVKGRVTLEVNFPIDWRGKTEIACKHCYFYVRSSQRCALNQEIVNFPEHYVGDACPLEIVEEGEENNV